jgi:hypothetical protein
VWTLRAALEGGLTPGERRNFTFASGTLLEHVASADKLVTYFTISPNHFTELPFG